MDKVEESLNHLCLAICNHIVKVSLHIWTVECLQSFDYKRWQDQTMDALSMCILVAIICNCPQFELVQRLTEQLCNQLPSLITPKEPEEVSNHRFASEVLRLVLPYSILALQVLDSFVLAVDS